MPLQLLGTTVPTSERIVNIDRLAAKTLVIADLPFSYESEQQLQDTAVI